MSLELKQPPSSEKYYQGMETDHIFGMAKFLRDHHALSQSDIGLEFLSAYYKILWSPDFDEAQRAIFKRRVTMDCLIKDMEPAQSRAFQIKYGPLAKQPNPPEEWARPYAEISTKLDSPITLTEKLALEKIFWVRDCDNLEEKTLQFASDLIEAVRNKIDPVEIFARFAYRFIHIHPFANGNSRVMQTILNAVLVEAGLPTIFLGNIFSTRKELYENYFHPENEESIIAPFVEILRNAIALKEVEKKEKQLQTTTQLLPDLKTSGWKVYPKEKLTGKYIGHQVRFFTFKDHNKEHANKFFQHLKMGGFDATLKQTPSGNPSLVVDLTTSLLPR